MLMSKSAVWIGAGIGSTIGGFIPTLWHADLLSPWVILFSTIGGIAGIWGVYKLYNG
jgi:hypothetical protein